MLPIRLMLVAGSLLAVATAAHAQDAVKVSPHLYKVLLENDQVRVIEFRAKPGQKEAMHSHPAAVVYLLSTGKSRSTTPDGRSEIFEGKAGTSVCMCVSVCVCV